MVFQNMLYQLVTGNQDVDNKHGALVQEYNKNKPENKQIKPLELKDGELIEVGIGLDVVFDKTGKAKLKTRVRPYLNLNQFKPTGVDITKKGVAENIGKAAKVAADNYKASKTNINSNKAIENVRTSLKYSKSSRGMSTFDFDETLIDKGENFIVAKKGDDIIKISSGQWPIQGPSLAEQGYEFDFT